jgi:hypothetical protein
MTVIPKKELNLNYFKNNPLYTNPQQLPLWDLLYPA